MAIPKLRKLLPELLRQLMSEEDLKPAKSSTQKPEATPSASDEELGKAEDDYARNPTHYGADD